MKLKNIGELELIQRLASGLPVRSDVVVGVGDDAAVVRMKGSENDLLLTTDAVIEGTHFSSDAAPEGVGHKAAGRALSDIAAMGGVPRHILINLVAPPETDVERIERMYKGIAELVARHNVALVGGDTARGPVVELHVFGVGEVPRGKAVLRSGAKPGDMIYVTGSLGGSLKGRHLEFEPRVKEGQWLREGGWVHAMIDVSDGLATDLRHIIDGSHVGARLVTPAIPVSPAANSMKDGRTPLDHALFDGEDFELLFTVPKEKAGTFEKSWKNQFNHSCAAIGSITDRKGVIQLVDDKGNETELKRSGYEHFR